MFQRITKELYCSFGLCFTGAILGCYLNQYGYSTNIELDSTGNYFVFPACLISLLLLVVGNLCFEPDNLSSLKLTFITVLLGLSVADLYGMFNLGNEHLYNVLSYCIAAYIFCFHVNRKQYSLIWTFISLITLVQLYKAYNQYFSYNGYKDPSLAITGYFDNSGLFSVYLVSTFPLLLYAWRELSARYRWKYLWPMGYLAITLSITVVLTITLSRTSILCFMLANVMLMVFWLRKTILNFWQQHKWLSIGIVLLTISSSLTGFLVLYRLKYASAQGRLLIWEICLNHIKSRPLLGFGLGSFAFHYPNWQANYFQTHTKVPSVYFLSAGETVNSFNEYLQTICEMGLVGLIVFSVVLFQLFRTKPGLLNDNQSFYLKLTLLTCLASAFTFYSFHATAVTFLFLLAACAVLINQEHQQSKVSNRLISKAIFSIAVIILSLCLWRSSKRAMAIVKFNQMESGHNLDITEILKLESNIYPVLKTDGKFLTRLGMVMKEYELQEKAKHYLEESKAYYSGYENHYQLALTYVQSGDYSKGIAEYEFLSCYIPSKYGPKYELFKIYISLGDHQKAIKMGNYILQMPVKRESTTVKDIKTEVQTYLKARHLIDN